MYSCAIHCAFCFTLSAYVHVQVYTNLLHCFVSYTPLSVVVVYSFKEKIGCQTATRLQKENKCKIKSRSATKVRIVKFPGRLRLSLDRERMQGDPTARNVRAVKGSWFHNYRKSKE